jgi:hypothetical protein
MKACGGLPNCYTLECNYVTGKRTNYISPRQVKGTKDQLPEDSYVTDGKHKFYADLKGKAPIYNIDIFEDVGTALCYSLLDYYKCNSISRLPTSWFKSLDGVKNDLVNKCNIFLPKPSVPGASEL